MNTNTNFSVTSPGAGLPPPAPSPQVAPLAAPTGDRFESSAPADAADTLRRAARELTRESSLDKARTHFSPAAWTRSADGTVYIGYNESGTARKSYLSAVDPTGRIAWELDLGESRVTHLGLSPEGSIQVGTLDGHLLCSKDGRLAEARTGGPAVRSHHQDSTGMHLEILGDQDRLRAVGPDGAEIALPADLQGVHARSVQATPEGGLIAFGGGKAVRLGPGGASATTTPIPAWPGDEKLSYTAERAWGLVGGDVLVQRSSYMTMRNPIGHAFGPDGMAPMDGFGGFMNPGGGGPSYLTRTAFVRLASDGTERWKSGEFSDTTRLIPGPEGSILFNDGGKEVRRVNPEGKPEKLFDLPARADIFRAGLQPGSVLIRAADQVTRLGPDGAVKGEVSLSPDQRSFQLEGDLDDGRILFRDGSKGVLLACDPATGTWVCLTDPEGDHTLRAEDLAAPGPAEKAGEVKQGDDWVVIGEVTLPRK